MGDSPPGGTRGTRVYEAPGDRIARRLGRTQLFRNATPGVVDRVARMLQPLAVPAGGTVAREGDVARHFCLIESGTVVVSMTFGGNQRELARIGPGDYFGEVALLGESGRLPTIRAVTEVQLLTLGVDEFRALMAEVPELAEIALRTAEQRKTSALRLAFELEEHNVAAILERKNELTLGRDASSDLVFDGPTVSRHHAVIRIANGRVTLTDLNSTSGTFVNGQTLRGTAEILDGDEIELGDQRFVFDRGSGQAVTISDVGGIRIDAIDLRREIKKADKTILQDVSLTILPGEFVAIVGGSGAGKTTLMDALAGVGPATSGQVLYNGRDYYENIAQYRHALGYVPQDDILHVEMPLHLTWRYAAKLRLPRGTPDAVIEQAIEEALVELGLEHRRDVRVGQLSGGQRKRASIGIELLTQPRVFFLDEPTSGLDPATDRQMMQLMRRLADQGRTVVLTTHATKNVSLCDKVIVLARDGYLAYIGTPQGALEYFGVESFDEIYDRVDESEAADWATYFKQSPAFAAAEAERATPASATTDERHSLMAHESRGLAHQLHQFRVLSHRHFDLYARHPINFVPLIMQPVVFTLLLLALFKSGAFNPESKNFNASAPFQLIFMFSFMVFLYGLLFGAQEIVKEQAIFRRERQVNVGVVPYLMSKTSFLAPLLIVCGCIMTFLLWLTGRMPSDVGLDFYLPVIVTLSITSWAGLAFSLFISSAANNSQQATDLLTPIIAPQVLFAGALFAVASMGFAGKIIAALTAVRWSLEAMAVATDIKGIWAADDSELARALLDTYADSFNSSIWVYWGILAAFVVVPLVGAGLILNKKTKAT